MSKHKAARRRATGPLSPAPTAPGSASPGSAGGLHRGGSHRSSRHRRPAAGALGRTAGLTGVAAVATGAAVVGGILVASGSAADGDESALLAGSRTSRVAAATAADTGVSDEVAARDQVLSRSDRRAEADPAKAAVFRAVAPPTVARSQDMSDADPREIARALLPVYGFGPEQFSCLDALYVSESNWRVDADNPYSSAYGIPQALPGSKMASAGADWATNPVTQIRWGLGYIRDRYGTPCSAWSFKQGNNWY